MLAPPKKLRSISNNWRKPKLTQKPPPFQKKPRRMPPRRQQDARLPLQHQHPRSPFPSLPRRLLPLRSRRLPPLLRTLSRLKQKLQCPSPQNLRLLRLLQQRRKRPQLPRVQPRLRNRLLLRRALQFQPARSHPFRAQQQIVRRSPTFRAGLFAVCRCTRNAPDKVAAPAHQLPCVPVDNLRDVLFPAGQ
jgi:hypothetical protein